MKHASPDEYLALLVSALVLIIVLVSSFMCMQLYHLHKPGPPSCGQPANKEGFFGELPCSSKWLSHRRGCHGITSGNMPAVET